MCGIVGYLGPPLPQARETLERAAAALRHRGPDDAGFWQDEHGGIALAHRRLSVIELSPAGRQPMVSHGGRWVVVFNGEIYNHVQLRDRLARATGVEAGAMALTVDDRDAWRGHSDTETLLECIACWGIERALDAVEGMFALALWDRHERALHLARDRMGEKPLYCGWVGRGFAFASELKALRTLPGFDATLDRAALAEFMRCGAVPAPLSIYEGVRKLLPGTWLTVSGVDVARRQLKEPRSYWRLVDIAQRGHDRPLEFDSDAAAIDALEAVVSASIRSQMLADVPLGAFLSGGVDSSTVVALMQKHAERPVRTFSIGFHEPGYDEAGHARAVARHLGTDHVELYVDDHAAREVIPRLPQIYCEPFADSSQIPTFLVSELARQAVTVSLSGDGGDELFGGYGRYFLAARIWSRIGHLPVSVRRAVAHTIRRVSPQVWNAAFRAAGALVPARHRGLLMGDKLHKGAEFLSARTFEAFYRSGFGTYWEPGSVTATSALGNAVPEVDAHGFAPIERMMLHDALDYLPNVILTKVDRAAMAVSLETRVPLLAREVVEFAWMLPMTMKVRHGQGKWILRQLLERHVPRGLVDRPKMGFGVPIDTWLRGPIREWAEALLDPARLRREGYLDPGPIGIRWREHQGGDRNWHYQLWPVLMFQAWLESRA